MFYYNRQVIYMDLWKAGERVGNAGFLKLEETDREIRWQISIRGLPESDTGFYDLRDETGALVDKFLLQKGEGSYIRSFSAEDRSRGGRLYGDICGLKLELSAGRYLKGTWKPKNGGAEKDGEPQQPVKEASGRLHAADAPAACTEPKYACRAPLARQGVERGEAVASDAEPAGREERRNPAARPEEQPSLARPGRETERAEKNGLGQTYCEDKWEQLRKMYPCVHPFGDQRAFLSITPGDFVILGQEYQKLVHNSFLLHGYYNYRHVILGRFPEGESESYYLGVPGVYYEREKLAAEMFGFEAFEGKTEPAEPGSFGYYMKRVRI